MTVKNDHKACVRLAARMLHDAHADITLADDLGWEILAVIGNFLDCIGDEPISFAPGGTPIYQGDDR